MYPPPNMTHVLYPPPNRCYCCIWRESTALIGSQPFFPVRRRRGRESPYWNVIRRMI